MALPQFCLVSTFFVFFGDRLETLVLDNNNGYGSKKSRKSNFR